MQRFYARAGFGAAAMVAAYTAVVSTQTPPPGQAPPPSMKGAVLKGKAPVSDEVLSVKLPRPQTFDLPNGIHAMVLEDRRVPTISMQIIIPGAGGYQDPADQVGLAGVVASMMREGTTSLNTLQIAERLETNAATVNVNAGISSEDASVFASSLTEQFADTLALTADILLNPSFPADELNRYKVRTRAGLIQQRSNPGFLGAEMFAKVLYGDHPAGRISPTVESLDKVTREALVAFHKSRYVPDHAVVAIAGDITTADARKALEGALGGWKKAGTPVSPVTDPAAPGPAKVVLVARPNSVQTSLTVGSPAIARLDPDYDVVSVMNKVIGGGPTGRLFMVLREDKGYTYGAYSNVSTPRYRGDWQANTSVRTEVTEAALRDLLAEVARLRDEPVPEKEFLDARRSMVASFALSLESPQAILGNYITQWRYKLPADYWDKYPARIMAVTREQVQQAAKKYLDAPKLQIVAVGDAAKVAPILAKHGELQVFDADGKKVAAPQ